MRFPPPENPQDSRYFVIFRRRLLGKGGTPILIRMVENTHPYTQQRLFMMRFITSLYIYVLQRTYEQLYQLFAAKNDFHILFINHIYSTITQDFIRCGLIVKFYTSFSVMHLKINTFIINARVWVIISAPSDNRNVWPSFFIGCHRNAQESRKENNLMGLCQTCRILFFRLNQSISHTHKYILVLLVYDAHNWIIISGSVCFVAKFRFVVIAVIGRSGGNLS